MMRDLSELLMDVLVLVLMLINMLMLEVMLLKLMLLMLLLLLSIGMLLSLLLPVLVKNDVLVRMRRVKLLLMHVWMGWVCSCHRVLMHVLVVMLIREVELWL